MAFLRNQLIIYGSRYPIGIKSMIFKYTSITPPEFASEISDGSAAALPMSLEKAKPNKPKSALTEFARFLNRSICIR